jgi:hypothetical protein
MEFNGYSYHTREREMITIFRAEAIKDGMVEHILEQSHKRSKQCAFELLMNRIIEISAADGHVHTWTITSREEEP